MYKNKRILSIIPARGGSKGIPHKNIMELCGKPLIAYSIEAAKKSKYIDKVLVSTDDQKIKEVSVSFGAEVPFLRPEEISNDSAKSIDVVLHAVNFLKNAGESFDYVILLQPTSPLRSSQDIDEAIEKLVGSERESLVSVCEASENPVLMRKIEEDRLKEIFQYEGENLRRQELPSFYIFNGAIYIDTVEMLFKEKRFVDEDTIPYVMEKGKSIDIDTYFDARIAELYLNGKFNK